MRKGFYRLTAAIITFVLGICCVMYFQRPTRVPATIEVTAPSVSRAIHAKSHPSISCDNELLRQITNELFQDEDFKESLTYDNFKSFKCAENFKIESTDLNRDGKPETVVQGLNNYLCSPTGNCSFWVYRETEKGYEKLLEASGVQQYYFKKSFSNGYRDIITAMHGSAWDSDLFVFRFDGEHYRLKECLSRSYGYLDAQRHFRETRRPIIRHEQCQAEE